MAEQEDLNKKLIAASGAGNLEEVISLINEGASINCKDLGGYTPLHCAAEGGYLDIIHFLIGRGCDPNIKTDYLGWTPLHRAARGGQLDTIRFLIGSGGDPNIKDDYSGYTPLHLAAIGGYLDTIRFLIDRGCDPNIKTKYRGEKPYDLTDKNEIKEYLLEAMSRKGKKTEEKSDVSKNEDETEKTDKELEETTEKIKYHRMAGAAIVKGLNVSEQPDMSKGAIPKQQRKHAAKKSTSQHPDSRESSDSECESKAHVKSKRRKVERKQHKQSS